MPQTIQPAVVGATGYAGFELARLLARHPQVKKPVLFTRNGEAGTVAKLDELYPHVSGNGGYPLVAFWGGSLSAQGIKGFFFAPRQYCSSAFEPQCHVLGGDWMCLKRG